MGRRITDNQAQSDHDVLLSFRGEMTTKMDFVIDGLSKLSDTVTNDVASLKQEKLDKAAFDKWQEDEFDPLKKAFEQVQKLVWGALGVVSFLNILSIAVGIYVALHH